MDQYQQDIKQSLWQAQQLAASKNALGGQGVSGLAFQATMPPLNYAHLNQPPMPNTVRSLTEQAHAALGILESEMARLADMLGPVRECVPVNPGETGQKQCAIAPAAIDQLQTLIARIETQMRFARQIAEELRI